jgi:hypothetical protein
MMSREGTVTRRVRRSAARSRAIWLLFLLVVARPAAAAQDTTSLEREEDAASLSLPFRADSMELSGRWVPLGPPPVDQAGSGRRGYVLAGEDSDVTGPRSNRFSIHAVAANAFYREETSEFLITRRYEAHSLALDYRRGFAPQGFPRFELGGHVQLHQSDDGFLNGFIFGMERFLASLSGQKSAVNGLRRRDGTLPPLGTWIERRGSPIYVHDGSGSGVGDVYATAKIALLDFDPSSRAPRVSARIGMNVAGRSDFTEGNYVGAGISLDQKVSEVMAVHGDIRVTRVLDETSVWNLPLKPWTYGFSLGPEFRLPKQSALNIHIDGSSTPYPSTGALAFDKGYGSVTLGLGRRFGPVTAQLYFRENMDLPFSVRWNTDPDLSIGLRIKVH